MAPEFLERGEIARSADLYSLGVIIIEILTGQKGYQAIEDVRTIYGIVTKINRLTFSLWSRKVYFKILFML